MTDTQQKVAARKFAAYWKDKGYEKGQSQTFWLTLLSDVLGVEDVGSFITFEEQVKLDHTSFIDGIIPSTHVLIEQKSIDKNLKAAIKQSDGSLLSPFQQAKRYAAELPYSQRPRWIVICNFAEFHVYDMERPGGDPEVILLADLEKEYYRLQFLVDTGSEHIKKEMEISLQAGELVGVLYDALLKQYKDPSSQSTLQSLNKLCVRLVFCLYAEDAGIFGGKSMFHDYLRDVPVSGIRRALVELFKILDQKPESRDKYLADDNPALAVFPYVNGGLFSDEDIEIPPFTEELKTLLLENASEDFNWSDISPTIFGAVFESTLNPETRRSVNEILKYPEDSAGSIMTTEFVDLKRDMSVADALKRIRRTGIDKETINICYVTDPSRRLLGLVSIRTLLLADQEDIIEEIMETNVVSATTMDDKEDVAQDLSKYDFLAMPVVDKEHRLVGIVTIDDAIDVMEEEATEDFELMAAITPTDKPYLRAGVWETVKSRLPWLMLLMLSATFTGVVISSFEDSLAACSVLIGFIPMLMGTGGNCGNQSSVAVIRGLSLNEIGFGDLLSVVWKESRVALLCGVLLAAGNFAKLLLVDRLLLQNSEVTVLVALVICLTLVCTVFCAKVVGCLLPLLAEKIGLDPAVMAAPFISTIVDVLSLLIYFQFATHMLGL